MRPRLLTYLLQIFSLFVATAALADSHLVVSVPEQRLYVFNSDGEEMTHYRISTSKFGVGDCCGSYNTPLGQLEIASKIGSGSLAGTVYKACARTGEVVAVNARGRDPIVTRILWLRGLESQNASAYSRHIYIHGTPDETHLGQPASYGCIRMRSKDVIALYETVEVGTRVEILNQRVGSFFGKTTWAPAVIASAPAAAKARKTTVATVAASVPASTPSVAATAPARSTSVVPAGPSGFVPKNKYTDVGNGKFGPDSVVETKPSKSSIYNLSEPLIGAPDTDDSNKAGAKKKSAGTSNGKKNRS